MTTLFESRKKCGCCGKTVMILQIGSTNAFGSCDLDMRPPEMERSAMLHFMQFCSHCGYAAWDLREKIPPSDALRAILAEKISGDDKAALYERAARIAELKGAPPKEIGDLYLTAAWAADDMDDAEKSPKTP